MTFLRRTIFLSLVGTLTITSLYCFVAVEGQVTQAPEPWDKRVLYPYGDYYGDSYTQTLAGWSFTVNLQFQMPFYGSRYNYSFVFNDGFLSFAEPPPLFVRQTPIVLPWEKYPEEVDPAIIAVFMSEIDFYTDSKVYYRTAKQRVVTSEQVEEQNRKDKIVLDQITGDIRSGVIGASKFTARYAFLCTWHEVTFKGANVYNQGGPPLNSFQVACATDEVHTFCILNYEQVTWVASTNSGGHPDSGLGGNWGAVVGFNAGNGSEWWPLTPFSGNPGIARIDEYTSTGDAPGRWIFRVDEVIERGGCTNETQGVILSYPSVGTMFGGEAVNISGPCFVEGRTIKARFETQTVECKYVNETRARCLLPMFYKSGAVQLEVSHDGTSAYNFKGWFFISEPTRHEPPRIQLEPRKWWIHKWEGDETILDATQLEIRWDPFNMTYLPDARLELGIWGYREDLAAKAAYWEYIDELASGRANDGLYTFKPTAMTRNNNWAYKRYDFGAIRFNITGEEWEGHYWSPPIPLAWYFQPHYRQNYGGDWAMQKCMQWHDSDSQKTPILNSMNYCPCTLEQAETDKIRWVPDDSCNKYGKLDCEFNVGAQHCVRQSYPNLLGASQQCCYDIRGNIMHVFDTRYGSTPDRSHPWGIYPHIYPPKIPDWCHYQYDIMSYFFCCEWNDFCDPYYWRRPSDDCQTYTPPKSAIAFGDPHFITFDGLKYSFNGKGEFTLLNTSHHHEQKELNFPHKLYVQVRFEQPPNSTYNAESNGTMMTAIVARENESATVEVQSRPYHARWRYKLTVLVDGRKIYFDRPYFKAQVYKGVTVFNPYVNLNQSEVMVQFGSGGGFHVQENHGSLTVTMFLPLEFKHYTRGLLGTWDDDPDNDFRTSEGQLVRPDTARDIFYEFGETWRIEGTTMFTYKPGKSTLYYMEEGFEPFFDTIPEIHQNASFDMYNVLATCGDNEFCQYDYITSGNRLLAAGTRTIQESYETMLRTGLKRVVSCQALPTPYNGEKHYYNYQSGSVVRFNCLPGYEFWGTEERRCMENGQWSDGISVLCRSHKQRRLTEIGNKIAISFGVMVPAIIVILGFFYIFYWRGRADKHDHYVRDLPSYSYPPPEEVRYDRRAAEKVSALPEKTIPPDIDLPIVDTSNKGSVESTTKSEFDSVEKSESMV